MVHTARVSGTRLLALGLLSMVLAGSIPFGLDTAWVASALLGPVLVLGGVLALAIGYASWRTRIEISDDGLMVQAPAWRACPLPPLRRHTVDWHEVRNIRERTERYRWLWLDRPVEVYEIDTVRGPMVLGGGFVPDLENVLMEVARRAGCLWIEDGEVELHPLRTLVRGAPPWPHDFQPEPTAATR